MAAAAAAGVGGVHSVKQGKVDSLNGRRGMVVSLDVEEFERSAAIFGFERIPGDDGPGELVQAFDEGMCWNVRWTRTGAPGALCIGPAICAVLRGGGRLAGGSRAKGGKGAERMQCPTRWRFSAVRTALPRKENGAVCHGRLGATGGASARHAGAQAPCSMRTRTPRSSGHTGACLSHAALRLAGKLGSYYTGAYKLYHLRVGANDTDKNALDLVLRYGPARTWPRALVPARFCWTKLRRESRGVYSADTLRVWPNLVCAIRLVSIPGVVGLIALEGLLGLAFPSIPSICTISSTIMALRGMQLSRAARDMQLLIDARLQALAASCTNSDCVHEQRCAATDGRRRRASKHGRHQNDFAAHARAPPQLREPEAGLWCSHGSTRSLGKSESVRAREGGQWRPGMCVYSMCARPRLARVKEEPVRAPREIVPRELIVV